MLFPFLEQVKLRVTRLLATIQRIFTQFTVPILLGILLGAIAGTPFGGIGKIVGGVVGGSINGYLVSKQIPQAKIASAGLSALIGILQGFLIYALYWVAVCRYFSNFPSIAGLPYSWLIGAIGLAVALIVGYRGAKRGAPIHFFNFFVWSFLFSGVCFFLPILSNLGLILLALLPSLVLNELVPIAGNTRTKRFLAKRGLAFSRKLALCFLLLQLVISFGSASVPFLHPLVKAAEFGDLSQVKELRQTEPRQIAGLAMLQAIDHQKPAVATFLLKSGAAVNIRNFYGDTPLSLATFATGLSAKHNCQPALENLAIGLIQNGAEVNVRGGFLGNTPLIQAAQNECSRLIKTLVQSRAEPNARNDRGETALWRTNNAVRKLLIQAGTDLNAMSYSLPLHGKHGRTALMYAIATYADNPTNALSTVKFLIQAGADVTVQNAEGETALSLAKLTNNAELMQILRRSGAKG